MLLSGDIAAPRYIVQRRRARISARKPLHVGHHRCRWFARQYPLEVTARQAVLALEKERPRQFQADPHQAGAIDQDGAQ